MAADPATPSADDALAARAQRGDEQAFRALVERYQRPVYGLALRMLGSPAGAEDAVQETFLSAWRALRSYRGGSFQAWILRIAGNHCRDELRKRKRRPTESLDSLMEAAGESVAGPSRNPSPEQHTLRAETLRTIEAGLATLPADQRMAVLLSDVQGLSYEEIAQAMNSSLGTVKSRISRGRAKLRDFLLARGELRHGGSRQEQQGGAQSPSPARSGL